MNTVAPTNTSGILQDLKGLVKLWPWLQPSKRWLLFAVFLIPVISGIQMSLPLILKMTIDSGITPGNIEALWTGSALFFGAVVLEYLARSGQSLAAAMAVHRMILGLRKHLMNHVLRLSPSFHDKSMSGALVTRATSDFDSLSESLNMGVLTSVVDCAVLIGCLLGMFVLNWKLALIALVMLPLVGWIVVGFSKALKSAMLAARKEIAQLNAWTQECLYGNTTIKLLNAEAESSAKFGRLNIAYRNAQMRSVILDAVMFAFLDGIASITVGLVLWFVIVLISDQATMGTAISAGVLVAFVQYIQQLFEPMKQLGNKMAMLQGAFTSIDRIFGILAERPDHTGTRQVTRVEGNIIFEKVTFAYRTTDPAVISDVSFELRAGQSLALVGPTGSGKSTIIKLITRMYEGWSGSITMDGQPLEKLDPKALRRRMAIVPQDIILFDGTIAFNIGLGDQEVGMDDIREAARLVHATRFIDTLPGGFDFVVREQGANLSHGQRQLIAFARALARKPQVIILDEATSSIDPQSESLIQQAIDVILKGHSVIVIAHRLSTIEKCDQILVLQRGKIVERGSHAELTQKSGTYASLLNASQGAL
jgi:ATP-binding cassette subfamily B multidrug efflux pump